VFDMYAQIATLGPEPDSVAVAALDGARARPEFVGGFALALIGPPGGLLVTLWDDAAVTPDPAVETFVVDGEWVGRDGGAAPAAALIASFDGPISPELEAAAAFGSGHRVVPAIVAVPGTIYGFAMWDPDLRARRVLTLTTTVDAIEAVGRAVNATELLPGEDRALLPGPDRVEVYRVVAAYTPAARH
jgi:hypothetical protein